MQVKNLSIGDVVSAIIIAYFFIKGIEFYTKFLKKIYFSFWEYCPELILIMIGSIIFSMFIYYKRIPKNV